MNRVATDTGVGLDPGFCRDDGLKSNEAALSERRRFKLRADDKNSIYDEQNRACEI